jgi:hypothetical protein
MKARKTLNRTFEEWDKKAAEVVDGAEAEIKNLWNRGRATVKGEAPPKDAKETVTLEARPEEVKILYARALAAQCLVDGRLDPREIQYLYVFMSRIGLGPDSREEVRRSFGAGEVQTGEMVRLVDEIVSAAPEDEEEIVVSVIKDLVQVARADGVVLPPEEESIGAVARSWFGEKGERVIELANKTVEYEEALITGDVDAGELERHAKEIASVAAAASVPITALFFSGSVVGLSAAGITSGLAALGLGGVLGLSAMVTGIGTVVVLGVAAYAGARWLLGGRERELGRQREHMIQEVIKRHEGAIEDLAEDVTGIGLKLAEYVSKSDQNEARLARLSDELKIFNAALAELRQEKGDLEARSA